MDNIGIWVVILILVYAVLRLWLWTEERLKNHVKHITDLEYEAKSLKEDLKWQQTETRILGETKFTSPLFKISFALSSLISASPHALPERFSIPTWIISPTRYCSC